MWQTTVEISPI